MNWWTGSNLVFLMKRIGNDGLHPLHNLLTLPQKRRSLFLVRLKHGSVGPKENGVLSELLLGVGKR